MPCFFLFARITLENQSTDHCNVTEFSFGHFSGVYASLNIFNKFSGEKSSYTLQSSTGIG